MYSGIVGCIVNCVNASFTNRKLPHAHAQRTHVRIARIASQCARAQKREDRAECERRGLPVLSELARARVFSIGVENSRTHTHTPSFGMSTSIFRAYMGMAVYIVVYVYPCVYTTYTCEHLWTEWCLCLYVWYGAHNDGVIHRNIAPTQFATCKCKHSGVHSGTRSQRQR